MKPVTMARVYGTGHSDYLLIERTDAGYRTCTTQDEQVGEIAQALYAAEQAIFAAYPAARIVRDDKAAAKIARLAKAEPGADYLTRDEMGGAEGVDASDQVGSY